MRRLIHRNGPLTGYFPKVLNSVICFKMNYLLQFSPGLKRKGGDAQVELKSLSGNLSLIYYDFANEQ